MKKNDIETFNAYLFYNTGFDSVNIPCSPEKLYEWATAATPAFTMEVLDEVNIVQTEWEARLRLNDITAQKARNIDYIVVAPDITKPKDRTCYTVGDFQDLGSGTIELHLFLDAYNTMGGFEWGSGNTVIVGSADRLTVPLDKYIDKEGHTEEDEGYESYAAIYPQNDSHQFFTLPEPFRPSNKIDSNFDTAGTPGTVTDTFKNISAQKGELFQIESGAWVDQSSTATEYGIRLRINGTNSSGLVFPYTAEQIIQACIAKYDQSTWTDTQKVIFASICTDAIDQIKYAIDYWNANQAIQTKTTGHVMGGISWTASGYTKFHDCYINSTTDRDTKSWAKMNYDDEWSES